MSMGEPLFDPLVWLILLPLAWATLAFVLGPGAAPGRRSADWQHNSGWPSFWQIESVLAVRRCMRSAAGGRR